MIKTFCLVFILILVLFACSNENSVSLLTEESQKYSFSKFIGGISNFPYKAPDYKIDKVISSFHKLKVGIDKKEAIEILGEPDAEFFSYDTTKGKIFTDSSFAYYLKRHEANLANESYDEVVFIYFDANEKLFWAYPDNIDLLKEIGTPFQ